MHVSMKLVVLYNIWTMISKLKKIEFQNVKILNWLKDDCEIFVDI